MYRLLAIFVLAASTQALTPSETCAVSKNEVFIGDPSDCTLYHYCNGGVIESSGNCPEDQYFDIPTGLCAWMTNGECPASASSPCTGGGNNNTFFADPSDCSKYIYCKGTETQIGVCPSGQMYYAEANSCVQIGTQGSCNTDCNLVAGTAFISNPTDCTAWTRCVGGKMRNSGNCAAGQYFKTSVALCAFDTDNECPAAGGTASAICAAAPINITTPTFFVADKVECNVYYFCSAVDASPVKLTCPPRFTLDESEQQCVPSYMHANNDCTNRCSGYSSGYVVAGESCGSYLYCSDNKSLPVPGTCPAAYPNFNEDTQTCVIAGDLSSGAVCTEITS